MSRFDYEQSRRIARTDPSFTALIMAAMRVSANVGQQAILKAVFPAIWAELDARYHSVDGTIASDLKLLPIPNPPEMSSQ